MSPLLGLFLLFFPRLFGYLVSLYLHMKFRSACQFPQIAGIWYDLYWMCRSIWKYYILTCYKACSSYQVSAIFLTKHSFGIKLCLLAKFQSSEKADSVNLLLFLLPLWRKGFWRSLLANFPDGFLGPGPISCFPSHPK